MFEESTNNEKNLEMLFNEPKKFVVENQRTVGIIVNRYIRYGYIHHHEKDEVIQYVNSRLLDGIIDKMKLQYNSAFYVSTYFAAIVNNLCKEFLNKKSKDNNLVPLENLVESNRLYYTDKLKILLNEEIERLDIIFRLYHRKRKKVILALKIKYNIEIAIEDVNEFINSSPDILNEKLQKQYDLSSQSSKENQLFDSFGELLENFDGKKLSGQSFKHWTYTKISEIIDLLNKERETSYDMETFGLLFEKYSEKMSKSEREIIYLNKENF